MIITYFLNPSFDRHLVLCIRIHENRKWPGESKEAHQLVGDAIGGVIVLLFGILIVMNIGGQGVRILLTLISTGAISIGLFRIVAAFQLKNITFEEVLEMKASHAEFRAEGEGFATKPDE